VIRAPGVIRAPREPERRGPGPAAVVGGALACLALAFVVGVVLPLGDPAVRAAAPGEPRSYDELALRGRSLYVREGCVTCHTQAVRDAYADAGLGPRPSEPGDYRNEAPNLIGTVRLGPDLTCVGDRQRDPDWFVRHLRDPQAVRRGSTMPSYAFLSEAELRALAAYLLRLTCRSA
jgi:cytochrome c oxidase cbb3-type subunit 2